MKKQSEKIEKLHKLRAEVKNLEKELFESEGINSDDLQEQTSLRDISDPRLLMALPDMLFVIDENGVFEDYHANNEIDLFIPGQKIPGAKIEAILPKTLAKLTYDKLNIVIAKQKIEVYAYFLDINGKPLQFETRMVPYQKNKVIAAVKKISDANKAFQNAIKERDYLYGIMNSSPVGIMHLNEKGQVIFTNVELLEMFGKTSFDIYQECDLCKKILGEEFSVFSNFLIYVKNSPNQRVNFQREVKLETGKVLSFSVRIMRIKNPVNYQYELVIFVENISDYIRTQSELKQKVNELALTQDIGKISYWEFDIETDELRGFNTFLKYFPSLNVPNKLSSDVFLELIHPDDKPKVSFLFQDQTGRKRDIVEQFRLLINDEIRWVEVHSKRDFSDNSRNLPLIHGSVQDITSQKAQEEQLYQNQKLLDTLMEKLPVAVFAKDTTTRKYTLWNNASEVLFEINKQDALGKTDEQIHPESFANLIRNRDNQCLNSGLSLEFIDEKYIIKGEEKYINLFQMPVSIHGRYEVIVGIAIDTTAEKIVEQELRHAKEQAEKSDDLKSSFLANMSHEIRNPMNSIVGFSKILAEDTDLSPDEKQEFIELINTNAKQLLRLISDIIDIAKIENNKLKIFKQQISINSLLYQIRSIYNKTLDEAGKSNLELSLITNLPDNSCLIYTDEQRFQQIMSNLLSNAVKYTDSGSIEFGYTQKKADELEFFVKDTGVGISLSDQVKIFNKFQQVGNNKSSDSKGLGLSITRELVNYLGGRLWVESSPGAGSCFYFTLPVKGENTISASDNRTTATQQTSEQFKWDNLTLLIVDDRKDILSFVQILLKKTNVQILKGSNGKEAVEIVKKHHADIDAVLMDIQMPEMNGIEAMKIIKSLYPDIKIIAQTAFALEGDEEKFIQLGFDNYIPKPINKNELLKILSKCFKK
ncbi:MAG: ATP-binding protein [Bacteroidales bacterium]|nr:ATP-binding protein [Bacteroidales bacterium]